MPIAAKPQADTDSWDVLVLQRGAPFQTTAFCKIFEETWPGEYIPNHTVLRTGESGVAVIPSYLYTSCPRLDYVKAAGDAVPSGPILMSHALIGWYGYPLASSTSALAEGVEAFVQCASRLGATAMFAGVDERDVAVLASLAQQEFSLTHFHTLMTRSLDPQAERDALQGLPGRYRRSRGQKLRHAEAMGVLARPAQASEHPAVWQLLASMLEYKGVQADILPEAFVESLLSSSFPGLEVLIAEAPGHGLIGANVNVVWKDRYYVWLGGYRRDLLTEYHQSDVLYQASIERALMLGCREIQAGRSSYKIKLEFGYRPVRLILAVRGSSPLQHDQAVQWARVLERRHLHLYPELRKYLSSGALTEF